MKIYLAAFLCVFSAYACNGTSDFKGSGPVKTLSKNVSCGQPDCGNFVKPESDVVPGSDVAPGSDVVPGSDGVLGGGGVSVTPADANAFAKKGQSLDAYLLVDVSNSLKSSDPSCLRFDAMKSFKNSLKQVLGGNGDARVSVFLFSESARFHSTSNDFIRMSENDFNIKYEKSICSTSAGTNPKEAFDLAAAKMDELQKIVKKNITSVLFFTDGVPTVGSKAEILARADALKAKVNSRIFSVLLGNEGLSALVSNTGMAPQDFVEYLASSKSRVRNATDGDGLKQAFLSFLGTN